jgi:hypothetical protein
LTARKEEENGQKSDLTQRRVDGHTFSWEYVDECESKNVTDGRHRFCGQKTKGKKISVWYYRRRGTLRKINRNDLMRRTEVGRGKQCM